MKNSFTLFLFTFLFSNFLSAQQFNNFDDTITNLPIQIDTSNAINIWQIGASLKNNLTPFSDPNALMTDTVNTYPVNDTSSFYIKIDMTTFWFSYPFFTLNWNQRMDCESSEGGLIEVSYDSLQSWVNIFYDTLYQPTWSNTIDTVTLFNGQAGLSGVDGEDTRAFFCWSSYNGPICKVHFFI